jgi:hypothetical protein
MPALREAATIFFAPASPVKRAIVVPSPTSLFAPCQPCAARSKIFGLPDAFAIGKGLGHTIWNRLARGFANLGMPGRQRLARRLRPQITGEKKTSYSYGFSPFGPLTVSPCVRGLALILKACKY